MTVKGQHSIRIEAPPSAVWEWVGRIERHPEFSPKPYSATLTSGPPDQVGSRYRSVGAVPGDRHHGNDVEVVEATPPTRLTLRARDPLGEFTNRFDLHEVAGGTEVTYYLEFPPLSGWNAAIVPVLFPLVGMADIRKRLRLLKARVESAA